MDRVLRIERRMMVERAGQETPDWLPVANVWAKVDEYDGSVTSGELERTETKYIITTRYRPAIRIRGHEFRLILKVRDIERVLQIEKVLEEPRRGLQEIYAYEDVLEEGAA